MSNFYEDRFSSLKDDGDESGLAANIMLATIALFLVLFVAWSALAELDRVTRAQGRVIPSRQVQVVQNLEGGIIKDILVREGDRVQTGDILIRLDDTMFDAQFKRHQKEYQGLQARIARLNAELAGTSPVFPQDAMDVAPEAVRDELSVYQARMNDREAQLQVLRAQLSQRREAYSEAKAAVRTGENETAHAQEELKIMTHLVSKGAAPRIDLLRAEQRYDQARGELSQRRFGVERASSAVSETERELTSVEQRFESRAAEEMGQTRQQLEALVEDAPALLDRVARTEVRSPVDGIVNRLLINTVGGVAQPGMPLIEVVPSDDTLLIEARIRPEDIAFLHPGQMAHVKITAYDYTRYGILEGKIEHISPDAVAVDETMTTYIAHIRTKTANLPGLGDKIDRTTAQQEGEGVIDANEEFPIIPGMTAEVDILNGKRSVMDYFVRPLLKIRETAFREG